MMTSANARLLSFAARPIPGPSGPPRVVALALAALAFALLAGLPAGGALALKAIEIAPNQDRLDITGLGEVYDGRGDTLNIEAAAGEDGVTGRMSVRAVAGGSNPNWFVFALRNPTDKLIERWLVVDRYSLSGSGIIWPDLDARRVEAVTPSLGFVPERVRSDRADIFRLTLDPGQTITFVVEISSDRFARLHLWNAIDHEQRSRDRNLFNGIMLGFTGLLAVFLTAIFAANHKMIFPAAALFAWCVLAYLCVEFGFWHRLFGVRPEESAQYRAAGEAGMAAALLIFVYTFLRLGLWHGFARMLFALWIAAQLVLVGVAFLDPRLAATFARLSFLAIGVVPAALMLFLALRGQDRGLSLVPTWILLLVWIFAAGLTLTGRLAGEHVMVGILFGLVLIVVLLGINVTQYAFRAVEPLYGAQPDEQQLRSLAIDSTGAAVWQWTSRRDEIKVGAAIEAALGLAAGSLSNKLDAFAAYLHPADRERFKLQLQAVKERAAGELRIEFRMRGTDNVYRWFEVEAASIPSGDRRVVRCIGLIRDVTDPKRAHERLLHDAVHDSLTGLPNRVLLLDRLSVAKLRARSEPLVRPTVLFIDLDRFRSANKSFGLVVGDSLLITAARKIARLIQPEDTLGRVGGDQLAVVLLKQQDAREIARLAEEIRSSLRSPISIAGQEIVLTGSIGIAVYDGPADDPALLLREAEVAMAHAKRAGGDRIELFRPEMRDGKDMDAAFESEMRRAVEKGQLRLLYQPIVYMPTEELVGFEALVRWQHPKRGLLDPLDFVPSADPGDLVARIGSFVLQRAVRDLRQWHTTLARPEQPLFVSVNISSSQLFHQDLVNGIRHILDRAVIPKHTLRIEVREALVMENAEQAAAVLELLSRLGVGLALDDFGAGYSSLSYLQRFPFETIKVDRALVQMSGDQSANTALMRSIVALAHELGRKVVAEGVEAEADAGFLRSIGCDYAQGLHYGEPISDRDVLQLLRGVRKAERRRRRRGVFRPQAAETDRADAPRPASDRQAAATGKGARPRKGANGRSAPPPLPDAAMRPAAAAPASGTSRLPPLARTKSVGGDGMPPQSRVDLGSPVTAAVHSRPPPIPPTDPTLASPPPIAVPDQPNTPSGVPMPSPIPAAGGLPVDADLGRPPPLASQVAAVRRAPPLPPIPFANAQRPSASLNGPAAAALPPAIAASLARLAGSIASQTSVPIVRQEGVPESIGRDGEAGATSEKPPPE